MGVADADGLGAGGGARVGELITAGGAGVGDVQSAGEAGVGDGVDISAVFAVDGGGGAAGGAGDLERVGAGWCR